MKYYIAYDTTFMIHKMNRMTKEMSDKQRLLPGDFRFWRQTYARMPQINFEYTYHICQFARRE